MWKTAIDVLKAAVVLLLLIAGVLALPFFLAAVTGLLLGYILFVIIRLIRIEREKDKDNAKANAKARAAAGY